MDNEPSEGANSPKTGISNWPGGFPPDEKQNANSLRGTDVVAGDPQTPVLESTNALRKPKFHPRVVGRPQSETQESLVHPQTKEALRTMDLFGFGFLSKPPIDGKGFMQSINPNFPALPFTRSLGTGRDIVSYPPGRLSEEVLGSHQIDIQNYREILQTLNVDADKLDRDTEARPDYTDGYRDYFLKQIPFQRGDRHFITSVPMGEHQLLICSVYSGNNFMVDGQLKNLATDGRVNETTDFLFETSRNHAGKIINSIGAHPYVYPALLAQNCRNVFADRPPSETHSDPRKLLDTLPSGSITIIDWSKLKPTWENLPPRANYESMFLPYSGLKENWTAAAQRIPYPKGPFQLGGRDFQLLAS